MTVAQMRLQDGLASLADVVARMTVYVDFVRRNTSYRLTVIWIAEQDDGVNEFGVGCRNEFGSVVDDLRTLAVSANTELGLGALGPSLCDQLQERTWSAQKLIEDEEELGRRGSSAHHVEGSADVRT